MGAYITAISEVAGRERTLLRRYPIDKLHGHVECALHITVDLGALTDREIDQLVNEPGITLTHETDSIYVMKVSNDL